MLKIENCRERQKRLKELMRREEVDVAVLSNPKMVYYFSGVLVDPQLPHSFVMNASGASVLITNAPIGMSGEIPVSAADQVEEYTWHSITRDVSPTTYITEVALKVGSAIGRLSPGGGMVGVGFEWMQVGVAAGVGTQLRSAPKNLTPGLDQLRRQKDPDEIECIRTTVGLVEAGLGAVKSALKPGMTEFEVYSIYYTAMVAKAQTSVTLNGDFACGARAIRGGGPPTDRKTQAGDLYIIDTFPIHHGYVCDYTRTFAVDGRPTQLQQDAWGHIMEAHEIARRMIHPGTPTKEIYLAIKTHLEKFEAAKGSFWHHAGHGIGMNGWEVPWLTPGSGDVILDREVIACEPALYSEEMGGGIRLEHDYLVTPEGAVTLDHFPMDLA